MIGAPYSVLSLDAGLLDEGGPLAALRPLLPPACHMAACEASAALVPGAAATGPHDEDGWGEAALVAALTAVSRVLDFQGFGEDTLVLFASGITEASECTTVVW